jgi:DNA-binding GntR family transcriptional regulator
MADVQFRPLDAPEPLADSVYAAICDSIVDKTLQPGARVTESAVARQLGVSKTPVREALLRLRHIGVIEPDGVRGGRVVRPSRARIREAYEVREALEVFAVRAVAERGDGQADLKPIRTAAARSVQRARCGDHVGFRSWDFSFHRAIAEAAANPQLTRLIDDVFTLIGTLRQRDFPDGRWSLECAQGHARIARAIARGDVGGAESATREHIRQVQSYVLAQANLTA